MIKQNTNNPNATYYPTGEVVITQDLLKGGSNLRLAWKFTISSLAPNNEQLIYVDAISGEVIRNTPLIYDVNTPITVQTIYSGSIALTGDSFAGGVRLRENRNGVDIQTLNIQRSSNYANAIDFSNTNTNFTSGNWTNFNQDRAALDAHWGAESVLDYWRNVHNRNSLDGNGIRILGYVHYQPGNSSWGNAQWVGGTNNHFMQYGDGDNVIPNPLTALDISAHEMGHGITEFTANLTPGTQESGALNEGFSDIWGACVEHLAAPNKQMWLIGEDLFSTTSFNCIRSLQNPKSTTAAEGQHPDTYMGQFWNSNGEPHFNSTVLSHWFFLLSTGGSGTNDLGNVFSVNSIGINDAQLIAYRAESVYLHSSATYNDARTATISAATDLFGSASCQVISVTSAWYAVGVGNAPYNLNISNANSGNCSNATYSINNMPNGASVTWSVTSPLSVISSSGNSVTVNGSGSGILTANVTNNCGSFSISINISGGGTPAPTDIIGFADGSSLCANSSYNAYIIDNGYSYFDWTVSGGTITSGQGTSEIRYTTSIPGSSFYITCHVKDLCGNWIPQSPIEYGSITDCGSGGGYDYIVAYYPNPADNSITISNSSSSSATTVTNTKRAFSYKIYNKIGKILKQGSSLGQDINCRYP